MSQKIDIHGLFIDPETITDLSMQKRIAVFYPVFHEISSAKSAFHFSSQKQHILRFDHQEPYGIILSDAEQPDPSSYIVKYQEAVLERLLKGLGKAGKNMIGHMAEILKIDTSGDRQYRILQSGRNVKQTSIREIPAKVRLLSGQWVDVFKNTPEYDFQGGSPYAITEINALMLTIATKAKNYALYGAGVDASNEEIYSAYQSLKDLYNQIQADRAFLSASHTKKPLLQLPQINVKLPKVELKKVNIPSIQFQSPHVFKKNQGGPSSLPEDTREKDDI